MAQKYTFERLVAIAALERHAQQLHGKSWIEMLVEVMNSESMETTPEMKEVIEAVKNEVIEKLEDKLPPYEWPVGSIIQ